MPQEINCRFIDAVFTPMEVEAMTGVTPLLQRTWKRRGFLGQRKRVRASLTAHEVAQIMALQVASQTLPFELKTVQEAVSDAVPSILWYALAQGAGVWDIEGTPAQKAALKKAIEIEDMRGLQYLDKMVGIKSDQFGRYMVRHKGGWTFVQDLNAAFEESDPTVALVLNLSAIGIMLANAPKRPRGLIIATDIEIGPRDVEPHVTAKKKFRRK
jgi:hypothetical protein